MKILVLAQRRGETSVGEMRPHFKAEEDAVMKESLSLAFLTLLEKLQPAERAVFLLREVFDYDYAEITAFVGRKEAACRQLFSRAKKRLAAERSEQTSRPAEQQRLMMSFIEAVRDGDATSLMGLLSEDVMLVADGGGKVPGAATHPVSGREEVAQFSVGATRRFLPSGYRVELSEVNHQPAAIGWADGRAVVVMTVELENGLVKTVRFMANPDKLSHLQRTSGGG